eukprot:scaffold11306_cov73-Cylindrotheca_fusiformis.AAC.1
MMESWIPQPRPTGRPCQTISKAYAHTEGETRIGGNVVEEKLELHEGAYRGSKNPAPALNIRKDTGRSTTAALGLSVWKLVDSLSCFETSRTILSSHAITRLVLCIWLLCRGGQPEDWDDDLLSCGSLNCQNGGTCIGEDSMSYVNVLLALVVSIVKKKRIAANRSFLRPVASRHSSLHCRDASCEKKGKIQSKNDAADGNIKILHCRLGRWD